MTTEDRPLSVLAMARSICRLDFATADDDDDAFSSEPSRAAAAEILDA